MNNEAGIRNILLIADSLDINDLKIIEEILYTRRWNLIAEQKKYLAEKGIK